MNRLFVSQILGLLTKMWCSQMMNLNARIGEIMRRVTMKLSHLITPLSEQRFNILRQWVVSVNGFYHSVQVSVPKRATSVTRRIFGIRRKSRRMLIHGSMVYIRCSTRYPKINVQIKSVFISPRSYLNREVQLLTGLQDIVGGGG
jgi:hypothetical protein